MDHKDYILQKNNSDKHYWYKARRELISNLLGEVYKNYSADRLILEIGCGTGYQLPIIRKYAQVEGSEINPVAAEIARANGFKINVQNIETEELMPDVYDGICLFDVLEHINKDELVLRKIFSSLKNQGYLFLSVPAYNFIFSNHDKAMGHYRRYSRQHLKKAIENSGFKIEKIGYWNSSLLLPIMAVRIIKRTLSLLKPKKDYTSEAKNLPAPINNIIYNILKSENNLIKKNIKIPFGLSLYLIAKKP